MVASIPQVRQRIGRYEILERLGKGGAGVVFRANDPVINRVVAVKTLQSTEAVSAEHWNVVRERFVREAQTAGRLDHPNIVKVYDVGVEGDDGELYLVMEYVAGMSLDQAMERRHFSREDIVTLMAQIASALDAAHAGGVVHRDVKPANILLAEGGVAKMADFGIARFATSHLTQDASALGTPNYMSPEQVEGGEVDGRSDLFSLGVICYQLLGGRLPFCGDNAFSLVYQIVHVAPPRLTEWVDGLTGEVDRVLDRVLAKSPADRYPSGVAFVEDLRAALGVSPAPDATIQDLGRAAPSTPRSTNRRVFMMGAAAVLASAALWGAWSMLDRSASSPSGARSQPPGPAEEALSSREFSGLDVPEDVIAPERPNRSLAVTPAAPQGEPLDEIGTSPAGVKVKLAHWISEGTLVVLVDDKPVLERTFSKGLSPKGSTTWDAVPLPPGQHRIAARVVGAKGNVYALEPQLLDFPSGGTRTLRLNLGNRLTIRPD